MTKRIPFLASALILAFITLVPARPAFSQNQDVFVEDVEIRGNRRIPKESILYYVQSKPQDRFDQNLANRDLQAILQMGLFDPLGTKLYIEDGPRGGKIIIFQVKEYPLIRDLQYRGLKAATESDVLLRSLQRALHRDEAGRRPVFGGDERMQTDAHWRDYVLELDAGSNASAVWVDEACARLLAVLVRESIPVCSFQTRQLDLEDAFLHVTKGRVA